LPFEVALRVKPHAPANTESKVKKKTEVNGWEETRELMHELVKSQIALAQQNITLGQRLDAFAGRMDRMDERMQRLESNVALMIDLLHRLPDAVKEKMGFAPATSKP
jgi:predicted nuclease with TOPRIM domain